MSNFQRHLESFNQGLQSIREVEEESKREPRAPRRRAQQGPSEIEQIHSQAKEKASKEMADAGKTEMVLEQFKKFFSQRAKREKFMAALTQRDTHGLGYVTLVTVIQAFKGMGFRLMFDQVKALLRVLGIYDENRDRVFYPKLVNAVYRKVYRKAHIQKLELETAVTMIQRKFRKQKQVDPKILVQGLAQKIKDSATSISDAFQKIDTDHSGYIELKELEALVHSYGVNLTGPDMLAVFKYIDRRNIGKITYEDLRQMLFESPDAQFSVIDALAVSAEEKDKTIAVLLQEIQKAISESQYSLEGIFKIFDAEYRGIINFEAFYSVVNKIAPKYSNFEVRQVFDHIDSDKNQVITYDEFTSVFFQKKTQPKEETKAETTSGVLAQHMEAKKQTFKDISKPQEAVQVESVKPKPDISIPTPGNVQAGLNPKIEPKIEPKVEPKVETKAEPKIEPRTDSFQKKEPEISMKNKAPISKKPSLLEELENKKKEAEEKKIEEERKQAENKRQEEEKKKLEENKKLEQRTSQDTTKPDLKQFSESRHQEQSRKAEENKKKLEESKKTEERKKAEEKKEELAKTNDLKSSMKRPSSQKASARASISSGVITSKKNNLTSKLKLKPKPTIEERASKIVSQPQESQQVLNSRKKELEAILKSEIMLPLISSVAAHGDSLELARKVQEKYENRPVTKHIYITNEDWKQPIGNPHPRSLWACASLGRTGFLDSEGQLFQFDISTGSELPSLYIGSRPPLQKTPIIGLCISQARLFTLNKQWYLEAWDLLQQLPSPVKRTRVLAGEFSEQLYDDRARDLFPSLISSSPGDKVIINASSADGCLYVYNALSVNMLGRLQLFVKELLLPQSIVLALDRFCLILDQCQKLGISQERTFELLDLNGDGQLSLQEFSVGVQQLKLGLNNEEITGMFAAMDVDKSGSISLDEFWGALNMRSSLSDTEKKEEIKPPMDQPTQEALEKMKHALIDRGYTATAVFSIFDPKSEGVIATRDFRKSLEKLLAPSLKVPDINLLERLADKENRGVVNYYEFSQLFQDKKVEETAAEPRKDSLDYVLKRCTILEINLQEICRSLDRAGVGTICKDSFKTILINLPLGLEASEIETIMKNDLVYDSMGNVDYSFHLSKHLDSRRPIVEDMLFIDDLGILVYSCREPLTSVIFCKHLEGGLLAKLVGHRSKYPPVLMYVSEANTLVSGERRPKPSQEQCEILLWNLQRDLVDKFILNPPWTVKPYKRVNAHLSSVIDLAYLSTSQSIVSTGADGYIRLWNPTGTPYKLNEPHNLPHVADKPGFYKSMILQHTLANRVLSMVGEIQIKQCYKVFTGAFRRNEWLMSLSLTPSVSKKAIGHLTAYGVSRLNLEVPANHHDRKVPFYILQEAQERCKESRTVAVNEFRASLPQHLANVMEHKRFQDRVNDQIKRSIIHAVLFDKKALPKIDLEEIYALLVETGMLQSCLYPEFVKIVENMDKRVRSNPLSDESAYSHPGFAAIANLIKQSKVDLPRILNRHKMPKTNMVHRKSLKQVISNLISMTDTQIESMIDELDPNYSCKIEINHILSIFNTDILKSKIEKLAKPSEIVDSIRTSIFPEHALKFYYLMMDIEGPYVDLESLQKIFNRFSVSSQVVSTFFDLFKDKSEWVLIDELIKSLYAGTMLVQINQANQVLIELKCRLKYAKVPLDSLFSDFIAVSEFVLKLREFRVEATDEEINKAVMLLSNADTITYTHFSRHFEKLPETLKYISPAPPSKEALVKFLFDKFISEKALLKDYMPEFADEQGMITPSALASMLEQYCNIPQNSGITAMMLSEIVQNTNVHFSQFVSKARDFSRASKSKTDLHIQVRQAMEHARVDFQTIIASWESMANSGVLDIHDFVNVLRFMIPEIAPELLSSLLLLGPTISYKQFADEAFGRLLQQRPNQPRQSNKAIIEKIVLSLRSSQLSLRRTFELFDTNKDGTISQEELGKVLDILDIRIQNRDLQALMSEFDANQDGSISYLEFIDTVNLNTPHSYELWRELQIRQELIYKFEPFSHKFRLMALKQTQDSFISVKVLSNLLESLEIFDDVGVSELCTFAVEGTKREGDCLPGTINFVSFSGALSHLKIQEKTPKKEEAPDAASQLTNYIKREKQIAAKKAEVKEVEKELFEYLANNITESLEQVFTDIDQDKSGMISHEEFAIFMQKIGFSLTVSELKSILKVLDKDSDGEISYKELRDTMVAYGYKEPIQSNTHQWEDRGIISFFKKFNEQKEFLDYYELLEKFDFNSDGILTTNELYKALSKINQAEKIMNLVLVQSKHSLKISDLVSALERIEHEIPTKRMFHPLQETLEQALVQYNSFSVVNTTSRRIEELSLALQRKKDHTIRGTDLYSMEHKLSQSKALISEASTFFEEVLDYISTVCLRKISEEASLTLIKPNSNVLLLKPSLETSEIPYVEEFKIVEEGAFNYAINKGTVIVDNEEFTSYLYSSEGLRQISTDGNNFALHVNNQVSFHAAFQHTNPHIAKIIACNEKKVGIDPSDREIRTFLRKPEGRTLTDVLKTNGGLLNIPILFHTHASLFLAKFYASQLLEVLTEVHSNGGCLRLLNPGQIHISDDGLGITIASIPAFGKIDRAGNILSAPDISLCVDQAASLTEDPFLAPEFLLDRQQTSAVDIWTFGALIFTILFGRPPPSFVQAYTAYQSHKNVDKHEVGIKPSPGFGYNIYAGKRVKNGQMENYERRLGLVQSIQLCSFSGIVEDSLPGSELNFPDIQDKYEQLLNLEVSSKTEKNELGMFLDILAMCLQVDPSKRPTAKGLLDSPLMKIDSYSRLQIEKYAPTVTLFKSPQIAIGQNLTQHLLQISQNFTIEHCDTVVSLIRYAYDCLCDKGEYYKRRSMTKMTTFTENQKESMLKESLSAPNSELIKQAVKDGVFDMFVKLSIRSFKAGNLSVIQAFLELLTSIMYEMISYSSANAPYVSTLIESLLKLFLGEENCLASLQYVEGYVSKESTWTPQLYTIVGPLYKDTISEEGQGQHYYPVVKDFVGTNRHHDYFSELLMLAENLSVLRRRDTGSIAKKNALRHIRSMLQTKNDHKVQAALDFRLPQLILHCTQDKDASVRNEAVRAIHEISKGCSQEDLPRALDIVQHHRYHSILNFFSIAKSKTRETTKDFVKHAELKEAFISPNRRQLAQCFENPIFTSALVRLLKFKSEPQENKEFAARTLVNILRGSENMMKAALSPATDTLLTLCKCLVSKMAPLVSELLAGLLDFAPPVLIKAFHTTPGTESLIRDHELKLPQIVSWQSLMADLPTGFSEDLNVGPTVTALKNWLRYIYQGSNISHLIAKSAVDRVLDILKHVVDSFWVNPTSHGCEQIALVLELVEWLVANQFDFLWLSDPANTKWVVDKASQALEHSGSSYEVYPLSGQGVQCLQIIARFMRNSQCEEVLGAIHWGEIFAQQLILQFYSLRTVMRRNTEPLHILSLYAAQTEARLSSFQLMLSYDSLRVQFLRAEFIEKLVAEFLTDVTVLDAKHNKLTLDFLAFRECAPLRGEAIVVIQTIIRAKKSDVYQDLLLHLTRHKTIQVELNNMASQDPVIQATACELLTVLIESADRQIEYLLMQERAFDKIYEVFELHPILKLRFPVLRGYSAKFN